MTWFYAPDEALAVVESARCIGLAMLPPGRFHPFDLDTRGLGITLRKISQRSVRTCLLGIGGSATNDGGFGLANALGWRFVDRAGRDLRVWTELPSLHSIVPPATYPKTLGSLRLIVATDVENRLLGPEGATRVYGPQKGIRRRELRQTERALERLALVAEQVLGRAYADLPGSGAAGGLGFGLQAFAGAKLQSGIELYARYARLKRRLRWASLVLTGEGRMDSSTLMGKGVGELARMARRHHRACIGLAGCVQDTKRLRQAFVSVHALAPDFVSTSEAMQRPAYHLSRLARRIANGLP